MIRKGGCLNVAAADQHMHIKDVDGDGFTVETCRQQCKQATGCSIFFLNEDNGGCSLYKESALNKCTYDLASSIQAAWVMYTVESCQNGKFYLYYFLLTLGKIF